jgi:uncharacterized repeat protein (TIGR01451 family)
VDDNTTLWPPPGWPQPPPIPLGQGEFVEDLALYFMTDQIGAGTVITNLYTGLSTYLAAHGPTDIGGLRQGYVITMVKSPEFWWVAEEVEVSEDVILLLGFWEEVAPGEYQRVGGHYVTVPGVDKQGGLIAFSDPWYDGAEFNWPYAYPGGRPTVLGRVADGFLIPHSPHAATTHNDAGNLSHDVYYVVPTDSPGGMWGPWEYVEGGVPESNFLGQNGESVPYGGGPVQAEVDWAVSVSPVADVGVTKTVTPLVVLPGDWITVRLAFRNQGSLLAENVVLTDLLPSEWVNVSWEYWTYPAGLTITARSGLTYVWDLPDLAWMEGGVITVTAQVDPNLSWPGLFTVTNIVTVSTSSLEQYQVPEFPNVATATVAVQTADLSITKTVVPTEEVSTGDWVTFTIVYSNAGPAPANDVVITDLLPAPL